MLDRLEELAQRARALEPDAEERERLLAAVTAYAERFLTSIPELSGYVPDDPRAAAALAAGLSEEPAAIGELLEAIGEGVDRVGVNESAGHFFGFIPGSGLYTGALGDYLAAVTNRYTGVTYAGPGAVRLERQLVRWLAREIGYPAGAAGDLTSGGSLANLSAIVAAREAHTIRADDVSRTVVYLSPQTHHSVEKALRVAGLAEASRRFVALDDRYRMRPDALRGLVRADREAGRRPWLVVASAGATDSGAVDPLADLARLAREEQLWLHVDAAYGGAFVLCRPGRAVLRGIERSDSAVIDPHKGLFAPFGTGVVLVRDGGTLQRAFGYEASYLQDAARAELGTLSPSELSPELTRPFRGLRLWLALRLAGVGAFRAALEEKLLLARYFHERLAARPEFEMGPAPELSVVTFRLRAPDADADAVNEELTRAIQRDGRIFLSSTRLDGRLTLRLAILGARTHRAHVDRALAVIAELAAGIRAARTHRS